MSDRDRTGGIGRRARHRLEVILRLALYCLVFTHCGGKEPLPQTTPHSLAHPSGRVRIADGCVNKKCANTQRFNRASCACECPEGTLLCNDRCVLSACPEGQVLNTVDCICTRTTIQISQADYGNPCGEATGNVTDIVADLCNGRTRCDVYVHNTVFGDPFVGCPKGFDAVWTCSDGSRHTAHHDPVTNEGYTVPLSCS